MTLSASFNYSATAAQVVQRALEDLGVVVAGESVDSDDQSVALARLNDIVKQWSNPSDGSEGMKVWLRKTIYVFLDKGVRTYTLGPSGDEASETLNRTTVSAAEAAGQTTISSTTITGMTNGDVIGVQLDTGAMHWSTINGVPAAGTFVLASALPSAAAAGNTIYWYTTALPFRPTEILTAVLRDSNTKDVPVAVFAREAYRSFELDVADKTAQADPIAVLYEPKRLTGVLTLDSAASDVTKVLRMIVLSPADDIDSSSDDLAFPVEWFAALEWEVAKRCAPVFEKAWTTERQENWSQATAIARRVNPSGFIGGFASQDPDEFDPSL